MLHNLSLVMAFLINVFTNSILENLPSHEALVTGRVTAISNNQTQLFKHWFQLIYPNLSWLQYCVLLLCVVDMTSKHLT